MAPYQVYPEDDDEILGSSILHVSKIILLSWFRWRIFVYSTDRAVSGMGVTAWIRHKQWRGFLVEWENSIKCSFSPMFILLNL